MIAGAIGVPQRFYRKFAQYTRRCGYEVITFDYRGIALSAPRTLAGFRMDFLDWGRQDLAAVIDAAANRADALCVPVYVVAHSFGGHALGLAPNHARVRACVMFGTGAGWHGWMPLREKLKVLALWNVVGPALSHGKGFLPWSVLGMGEDLPLDVYQQWRRWCRHPRFFLDDPEIGEEMRSQFQRVQTPLLAVAALDDAWSPPRSRDAILSGFRRAQITRVDLDPTQMKVGPIGHMGFFRANAQKLWPMVIDWLESTYFTTFGMTG